MTTPERILIRRRLQVLEDEPQEQDIQSIPGREDKWAKSFTHRLSVIIRSIGRKKPS
jgi:hypothetical protein